jgi:uncharacterized surface protein with fasciclin (FAS1) repeats
MNLFKKSTLAVLGLLMAGSLTAQSTTMAGGEAMYPYKDIVSNAVNSADHTTLVSAVKAAGLVSTLQSEGPFTVLAPDNDAFENLPDGTVAGLLKPEAKAKLSAVLTYHVLPDKLDFEAIARNIKKGDGEVKMKTVQGSELSFSMNGKHNIVVEDGQGNRANISTYDVYQSNGVIHVIDAVLLP